MCVYFLLTAAHCWRCSVHISQREREVCVRLKKTDPKSRHTSERIRTKIHSVFVTISVDAAPSERKVTGTSPANVESKSLNSSASLPAQYNSCVTASVLRSICDVTGVIP